MDVGYAVSTYDCQIEPVKFLLFWDSNAAEQQIPTKNHKGRPFYLPLAVDLRRFVNPANVTNWPVLVTPEHPGYWELRRSWFDTLRQRAHAAGERFRASPARVSGPTGPEAADAPRGRTTATNAEPKDQPPEDIECYCPMCDVAAAQAWADLDYSWMPILSCKRIQRAQRAWERQGLEKKPGPAAPAPAGAPPDIQWPPPPIDDQWLSSIL